MNWDKSKSKRNIKFKNDHKNFKILNISIIQLSRSKII